MYRSTAVLLLSALLMGAGDCRRRDDDDNLQPMVCGDGLVRPGVEACDDGNQVDNDACRNDCTLARCGDGVVRPGVEACDDGNQVDNDACRNDCTVARCGDGVVRPGVEACDDGNQVDSDACRNNCTIARCGDGVVRSGVEACDAGSANDDRPAFRVVQGSRSFAVTPITEPASVTSHYNYFSASGHTGFEALSESRIYLYVNSSNRTLSLVMTHGIDFDTSGQHQSAASIYATFSDLPGGVQVILADDFGELSAAGGNGFGQWSTEANSDGGVLGVFPFPGQWTMNGSLTFSGGIAAWAWVDGSGDEIALEMNQPFSLVAASSRSSCRSDCSVPVCGDGILDAGEECDDGNTRPNDGCSPSCVIVSIMN